MTPVNANGVNLEIGMMDQQNGIFFRHANGKTSVVRRSSTFQLSGKATVTNGSSLVSSYTGPNGAGTKFAKQLEVGDYVVLRGSSYRVDGIISDTQMVIFPDYRGPSAINVPITKTTELNGINLNGTSIVVMVLVNLVTLRSNQDADVLHGLLLVWCWFHSLGFPCYRW